MRPLLVALNEVFLTRILFLTFMALFSAFAFDNFQLSNYVVSVTLQVHVNITKYLSIAIEW
jgi:hypothetical protein